MGEVAVPVLGRLACEIRRAIAAIKADYTKSTAGTPAGKGRGFTAARRRIDRPGPHHEQAANPQKADPQTADPVRRAPGFGGRGGRAAAPVAAVVARRHAYRQ